MFENNNLYEWIKCINWFKKQLFHNFLGYAFLIVWFTRLTTRLIKAQIKVSGDVFFYLFLLYFLTQNVPPVTVVQSGHCIFAICWLYMWIISFNFINAQFWWYISLNLLTSLCILYLYTPVFVILLLLNWKENRLPSLLPKLVSYLTYN